MRQEFCFKCWQHKVGNRRWKDRNAEFRSLGQEQKQSLGAKGMENFQRTRYSHKVRFTIGLMTLEIIEFVLGNCADAAKKCLDTVMWTMTKKSLYRNGSTAFKHSEFRTNKRGHLKWNRSLQHKRNLKVSTHSSLSLKQINWVKKRFW